jgi:glycosyltransferase involved in cell wall biosynthesis
VTGRAQVPRGAPDTCIEVSGRRAHRRTTLDRLDRTGEATGATAVVAPAAGVPPRGTIRVLMAVAPADPVGGLETSFARILPMLREQGAECEVMVVGPDATGSGSTGFFKDVLPTHPVSSLHQAARLVRRYDVVHAHGAAGTVLWPVRAVLACGLTGTPLVVTLHLPPVPRLPSRWLPAVRSKVQRLPRELLLAAAADVVAAPSEDAAAVARKRLAPLRIPVRALDNGVPDPGVLPLPPGPLRVVFLGRLAPQKQPHVFVDAVERAVAAGADLRADIVGDGPLRPDVERQLARSDVADRVTLHGHLADPLPVLAAGHVLALTTLAEGGPTLVAMEAAALGRGVVARDGVPGMRDEWGGGVFRVFASSDAAPAAFAKAFATLADDRAAVQRLGREARARYAEHHTAQHAARRLVAAYTDAVSHSQGRRP